MIFFGHLGITLAVARTADKIVLDRKPLTHYIDYRLVLAGSMLPDVIDKFILFFLSGERFSSGRMFAHSLMFALLFLALGMVVLQVYRKSWVLVLAVCCFFHQLLDIMWKQLNIFLWPVYDTLQSKSIQTSAPDILNMPIMSSEVIKGDLSWSDVGKFFSIHTYIFRKLPEHCPCWSFL